MIQQEADLTVRHRHELSAATICVVSLSLLAAASAAAQEPPAVPAKVPSQWGVSFGFTPRWWDIDTLVSGGSQTFDGRVTPANLEGTELRAGFVRGREHGDWGVSFVWKHVKEGSTVGEVDFNFQGSGLKAGRLVTTTQSTSIVGLEVQRFIPVANLGNRLQFGVNLAGGAVTPVGRVFREEYAVIFPSPLQRQLETKEEAYAFDNLLYANVVPTGKVELGIESIVTPRLRLRASGGFNYPGLQALSLTSTYLFRTPERPTSRPQQSESEPPRALGVQPRQVWGLSAAVSPHWATPYSLRGLFTSEQQFQFAGSELYLGITRGRITSADWGVAVVWKRIDEGSVVDRRSETSGTGIVYTTRPHTSLVGLEVQRFIPLTTIADRVQLGINLAGGAGTYRGTLDAVSYYYPLVNGPATLAQTSSQVGAGSLSFGAINLAPLGKAEFAVALIANQHLKVRVGAGFNYPGFQALSLTLVYLPISP
jgi:hypothetical protein